VKDHKKRTYDSIMELASSVDNPTPIVKLSSKTVGRNSNIYAKLEWYNPFGSIKDRTAANLISGSLEEKLISEGDNLVEPTSGNTGLALTMIGNLQGHKVTSPLSKRIPLSKRALLAFEGTSLIELDDQLCPAPGAPEGAIAKAKALGETAEYTMLNQYASSHNPEAHYKTTGPEIWNQTDGKITHFVSALGTCGTINGVSKYLKEKNPSVKVIGVYPEEGHDIPGVRSLVQLRQSELFDKNLYDDIVEVTNQEAFDKTLQLNRQDGIIAGPSSAMALVGALKTIDDTEAVVVVIFPDNIFKYTDSLIKHLPEEFIGMSTGNTSTETDSLDDLVELARTDDNQINLKQAKELYDKDGAFFLDVRSDEQFETGHISEITHVSNENIIANKTRKLPKDKQTAIITVCNRGNQSLKGLIILKSLGYNNVKSLKQGTNGWRDKRWPISVGGED
jgi:cysteine synthase/rhodanese-related sulfurtransferase